MFGWPVCVYYTPSMHIITIRNLSGSQDPWLCLLVQRGYIYRSIYFCQNKQHHLWNCTSLGPVQYIKQYSTSTPPIWYLFSSKLLFPLTILPYLNSRTEYSENRTLPKLIKTNYTCCLIRLREHCSNCSSLVSMVFPSFCSTCERMTTYGMHPIKCYS